MTYQQPFQTHDCDTGEEASSLLTSVTGSKKKNGVPSIRAMIVTTCLSLGTLAVICYGGSGSSNSIFHHAADTSEALLLRHNQAAPGVYDPRVYDPKQDFCFKDTDNAGKYCWYPEDKTPFPGYPQWKGASGHGYDNCGLLCTSLCDDDDNNDHDHGHGALTIV